MNCINYAKYVKNLVQKLLKIGMLSKLFWKKELMQEQLIKHLVINICFLNVLKNKKILKKLWKKVQVLEFQNVIKIQRFLIVMNAKKNQINKKKRILSNKIIQVGYFINKEHFMKVNNKIKILKRKRKKNFLIMIKMKSKNVNTLFVKRLLMKLLKLILKWKKKNIKLKI